MFRLEIPGVFLFSCTDIEKGVSLLLYKVYFRNRSYFDLGFLVKAQHIFGLASHFISFAWPISYHFD